MKIHQTVEFGQVKSVYLAAYSGELQVNVEGATVTMVLDLENLKSLKREVLKGIERFEEKITDLADDIKSQKQQA